MVPVSELSVEASNNATVLPSLSEIERNEILYAWNDTQTSFPAVCVHELFEQQVDRAPDAVAVVFEEQRLTYRELNQRANQVAHFLRKRGVGPESLVGVSLKRSPELVVALLGVWKSGGAYVPLDPSYPPERLVFMVTNARIEILLTDSGSRALFPAASDRNLCLDTDWSILAEEPVENPHAGAQPSNLAYVMYTSGSTGQPKGAMILHAGLVNYLCWAIKAYAVEAGGSVPVHSSISFDLTVTSLYPALLAGGQVELLPEDVGAQNLLTALRRQGTRNLVKITPAHLDLLGQQLGPNRVARLTKMFVIGGENLPAESVQLWRDYAPGTRLINEYGPTETVVGCCVHEVQPGDPESGSVPIGRPIANTQLYILDAEMQPVPIGATGELYIGGTGIARGYLHRPELTQERFLVDCFSKREGARLYRTGDLARYRADKTLEYLGRVDNQVKIRGYRIELEEIEATLAAHPAVQACAVLAREHSPGSKRLVGYVVPRPGTSQGVDNLVDFLKQRLPDYMLPAQFVLLESFPLTQNGKVDRKALPAPDAGNVGLSPRSYVAPRSDLETGLAAAWEKVLGVPRVGITDDFFDLGGTSLSVLEFIQEMVKTTGLELSLGAVFRYPTIRELVESLGSDAAKNAAMLVSLQTAGDGLPVFCLCGIDLYRDFARSLGKSQPVFGVYVSEEQALAAQAARGEKLDISIERLAEAYYQTIIRAEPQGPYRLAGISFGGVLAIEVASLMRKRGAEVDLVILLDAFLPQALRPNWLKWCRIQAAEIQKGNLAKVLQKLASKARAKLAKKLEGPRRSAMTVDEVFNIRQAAFYQAIASWDARSLTTDFNVVLFRASEQLWGAHVEAEADYGWRHYVTGPLRVEPATGDHLGIIKPPNVTELARIAQQYLNRMGSETTEANASR
jgi:amino acid adenylation domain-containing protein